MVAINGYIYISLTLNHILYFVLSTDQYNTQAQSSVPYPQQIKTNRGNNAEEKGIKLLNISYTNKNQTSKNKLIKSKYPFEFMIDLSMIIINF